MMTDDDPPRLSVTEPLMAVGQVVSQVAASLLQIRQAREFRAERHGLHRPGTGQALAADLSRAGHADLTAAEQHLTGLDPDLATQVRAESSWPALAVGLDDAAKAGHDPARVLSHVAAQHRLDTAESATAVLHWRLKQFLAGDPTYTRGWEAQARTADTLAGQARTQAAETATRSDDPATAQVDEHDAATGEHHANIADQAAATAQASSARSAARAADRIVVVPGPQARIPRRPPTTARPTASSIPTRHR